MECRARPLASGVSRGHQRVLEREHFQGGVGNRLFRARVHRGRDHVAARRNHGRGGPEIGVGEPADGQDARQEAHDRLHVGQGGMLEPGGDAVGNRPGRARRCPGRRGDGRRGRLLGHLGLGNRLGHCSQSNRSRGEGTTECPRAVRGEVLGYEARAGGGTRMRTECYHLPAPAPSTRAGQPGRASALNERRASMRHVKWSLVVGFVALALGVGAVVQAQQQLSGEYKIGVLEPLTGNLAGRGQAASRGLRDHARPHQRALRRRDGQEAGLRRRATPSIPPPPPPRPPGWPRGKGVKIITGTFSSTLCGAASEAAARQNVIYWETSCVDPRFTQRGLKNVYRTEIDGTGFGWYNIEFIAKHLAHRWARSRTSCDRVPLRGLLVRPERDRVGAPARQAGVRHAGGRRPSTTRSPPTT